MANLRLEDLFATYRTTRDPAALAAVFDATASELLLVAVHLCGDRAEAEDLVQTTFVELIERAEQYDSSRPFKPWLVGVLANRAKMALRRRRRGLARDLADADPTSGPGPVAVAEAKEVAEHVSRALESLPSHYRHILVLHLVHGLGGVQIAQSLDRPPATVRTQIKRGLEMLRGALPTALALPASLLATEGRGLAAVRSAVMEKAGEGLVAGTTGAAAGATLTSAAAAGGLLGMKKTMLVAVTAVLGVGAWFGLDGEPADAMPDPADRNAGLATRSAPALEEPRIESSAPRDELPKPEPQPATNAVTLRGRVIADWDQAPRRAETIYVRARPRDWIKRDPSQNWPIDLATGASGFDGRFEFTFAFDVAVRHTIELYGPDFVGISGSITIDGPGIHDLGDIHVRHGARLLGRVVDPDGTPVPNLTFEIEYPLPTLRGVTHGGTFVRSDAQGVLRMRDDARILAGEATLKPDRGWEIVRFGKFQVPGDREFAEPTIVVAALGEDRAIRGRVVDSRGVASARVWLRVTGRSRADRGHRDWTDADGNFTVFRRANDPDHVSLLVAGSESTVNAKTEEVPWGTDDLLVVQEPSRTIAVHVTDAESGEPIEDFRIFFGASTDPLWGRFDLGSYILHGPHDDGLVTLTGMPQIGDGAVAFMIAPDGDRHELSAQLRFPVDGLGDAPLEVKLQPRRAVSVRVVDRDGDPATGSRVRIVQLKDNENLEPETLILPRDMAWQNFRPDSAERLRVAYFVDDAKTDGSGIAHLRCALDGRRLGLVITGDHVPFFASEVALSPQTPLDVTIEAGARMVCTVAAPEQLALFRRDPDTPSKRSVQLALRRPGDPIRPVPGGTDDGYDFDDDGRVTISGLPAGTWEIVLSWMRPLQQSSSRQMVLEPPLATIQLAAGETIEQALDLGRLAPGSIRGTLHVDGTPLADTQVLLDVTRFDARGQQIAETDLGANRTDAQGRFRVGGLLPGDYRVRVVTTDTTGEQRELRSEVVHVARGQRVERIFDLP